MIDLKMQTRCFISSSKEDLDKVNKISQFLEKEGIEVQTGQTSFLSGLTILENLQNAISKVDFVIFLLPSDKNKSELSTTSLFYEIGLISGMGKPFLMLVDKDSDTGLLSAVAPIMYLRYESKNIESTFRYIKNWAAHSLENSI